MKLLEPVSLPKSGLQLANRLVMAPMPTFGADPDGLVGAAELAYYRRRAAGGLAAVVTAGCAVSEDGIAHPGQWRCDHDRFVDSLSRCARSIHSGGARAVLQIEHGGGAQLFQGREASRLIGCFGEAARRVRQAGFDAIALHGGHGELLQQLFSAKTNAGDWLYGGSTTAARGRLLEEIVRETSERFQGPCWYRLTPEEPGPDGITMEQTLELADRLLEAGVEVLDVGVKRYSAGSIRDSQDKRPRAVLLAQRVDAAVMAVGGLSLPAQAEAALADGCTLVGLGRVLLSEPEWGRKVAAGEVDTLELSLQDHTKLEARDVPPTVIDYFRRRASKTR